MAAERSAAAVAFAVMIGCGGGGADGPVARAPLPLESPKPPRVRTILAQPEAAFWVSRGADGANVIASGARFVVDPSGAVIRAAWDAKMSSRGERLLGAIPVAPRLGSGFVHWSGDRLYATTTFTGPLVPIARGADASPIRGVRNGVSEILVITDAGVLAWRFGAPRLTPASTAGLADELTLDGTHAVRVDALGRAATSADGGRTWRDAAVDVGSTERALGVIGDAVALASARGYFVLRDDGALVSADAARRLDRDATAAFALAESPHPERRDLYGYRSLDPLGAAVAGGATFGDGTALALLDNAMVRVDAETGREQWASAASEASVGPCTTTRAADGVLVACPHLRTRPRGAFVLRSEHGEPPRLERVFRDDGLFVTDGAGALLFTASCADAGGDDASDDDGDRTSNAARGPLVCARLRSGAWIELHLPAAVTDVPRRGASDDGEELPALAWVPRLDGATALVARGSEPQAGVETIDAGPLRVLAVADKIAARQLDQHAGRGARDPARDRRFWANAAGGVDGWLGDARDWSASVLIGASIDPRGHAVEFDPPAGAEGMSVGGPHALVATHDGALFETGDGGRHWSPVGASPLPPSAVDGGCTDLGCHLGGLARIGWGRDAAIDVEITSRESESASSDPTPHPMPPVMIRCAAASPPEARAGRFEPSRHGTDLIVSLPNGENARIERPIEEPVSDGEPRDGADPKPGSPKVRLAVKRVAAAAITTRLPFAPDAIAKTVSSNDAIFGKGWRQNAVALLGPRGEVGWLLETQGTEIALDDHRALFIPIPRSRPYSFEPPLGAVREGDDRWIILARARRRLALEERGPGASGAPYYFGIDQLARQRPIALGRRADGALGVVVSDGLGAPSASVAVFDRRAGALGPLRRLASWSTATRADAPECRADPDAFEAVVPIDATAWVALAGLPGATIGSGVALVRWGDKRVCVEAVEMNGGDPRRAPPGRSAATLSARWAPGAPRAAILRSGSRSELVCTIEARAR